MDFPTIATVQDSVQLPIVTGRYSIRQQGKMVQDLNMSTLFNVYLHFKNLLTQFLLAELCFLG